MLLSFVSTIHPSFDTLHIHVFSSAIQLLLV